MSRAKESDFGTVVVLLIMAAVLGFLIYTTNGFGGAFSLPFMLT